MQECVVYALRDPRTEEIRYVGQSMCGLQRARDHFRPSTLAKRENPHTANWLMQLKREGLKPTCEVIETVASPTDLNEAEIFWIAKCRSMGFRLTNILSGGDRPPVRIMPEAERRARSLLMMGHPGYWKGKNFSAEHRAKIATGCGKPKTVSRTVSHSLKNAAAHSQPFCDENGNLYHSPMEAAIALNLKPGSIGSVLRGKRNSVFGHTFTVVANCSTSTNQEN